ncbi:MAG: cation transporter [Blastopirellula sp.]|nr:MAG: cation transporter [Blastopirellula sp.]
MHAHSLENWQHDHDFSYKNEKGERRTKYVLILTVVTMIAEITAGSIFGSMALLADGWHMGTHVAAFFITIFAYRYSSKHAKSPAYSFGTGKVGVLGGFASAIALAVVALVMLVESSQRIMNPQTIQFDAAIAVALVGLIVNIVSALLLKDSHDHTHEAGRHHHHDHNLRAAYLHVLADALTSLLAIIALLSGKYLGLNWLDPIMGIVGAVIITRWSYGLLIQTGPILLDGSINKQDHEAIKSVIESDSDNRISDIHIWKVSASHYAAIISLVTHSPKPTVHYKELLSGFHQLSHITIEVYECRELSS